MDNKNNPTTGPDFSTRSNELEGSVSGGYPTDFTNSAKTYMPESLEVHDDRSDLVPEPTDNLVSQNAFRKFPARKALLVSVAISAAVMLLMGFTLAALVRNLPEKTQTFEVGEQKDVKIENALTSSLPPELQGADQSLLVSGDVITRGSLKVSAEGYVTVIRVQNPNANQTVLLPNGSGTLCLDTNNCNFANQAETQDLQNQINSLQNSVDSLGQVATPPAGVAELNGQTGSVSLQGSLNRVIVTTSGGVVTITTPQDLDANANVQFGNLTLASTGQISANTLIQTAAGQNVNIDAGNDMVTFVAGGRVFQLPTAGGATQTICTTGATCASGSGAAVILSPTAAQVDGTTDASIFINDTGGGHLLHLQTGGVDQFTIANNGDTTINGGLSVSGLGSGFVRSTGGVLSVVSAINLTTDVSGILPIANGGTGANNAGTARSNLGAAANGTNADITSTTALNTITPSGALTIGAASQQFTLQGAASSGITVGTGANTTTLNFAAPSGARTVTFPALSGTVCLSTGNCSASGTAGGDLTGTYPNPTIARLQGTDLNIVSVAGGQILVYNSGTSRWQNATVTGDISLSSSGAATIASNAVTTAKIADANVTNAKLQNSSLTVTAGGGLINGGSVALGSAITLNIGAGDGITVNADNVAVDATVCRTTGNCAGAGGGVTAATPGSANRLAVFTAGQDITSSWLLQNSSTLELDATRNLSLLGGNLNVTGTGTFSSTVTASLFSGSGASLTSLNASNLASGTVATGRISGSYTGITGVGTITAGTWNGTAITDAFLQDNITVSSSGTVDWLALSNYPSACPAGQAITQLGDTLTCQAFAANSGSGNYIQNQNASAQTSANFWIDGSGTANTLISTVATGTAPLTVVSTTLVANLNADQLDGQSGAYYLDLGNATGTLSSARIADGSLTNVKLQNSSITITAGSGLTNGGSVSLGGSVTLNIGAGDGITVNANDVAVDATVCRTTGNCAGTGSGVTASTPGSANRLAVFTAGQDITSSWLLQNGSDLELDSGHNLEVVSGNAIIGGTVQGTQLISTVASGTAPLTVASTTLVSNLNADLLDGQHGAFYQDAGNLNAGIIASGRVSGSYGGITGVGTLTAGVWQGSAIADAYLQDNITISSLGSVDWTALSNYPGACPAGQAIVQLGDTITCQAFASASGSSSYIQNTTTNQNSANFNIQSAAVGSVTAKFRVLGSQTADVMQVRNAADDTTLFSVSPVGGVVATSFSGDGASLTNLSASNIASGTLNIARIADGSVTNTKLQNSSLTVTAGNGLSGGGAVSLGASTSLAVVYGSAANTAVQGNTAITITAGTGLTGGGSITLGAGGSSTLNVAYGNSAGTAVEGNTQLTCASGTGNLSGGGNVITLGAGGSCGNLTITNSPVFSGTLAVQGASATIGASGQQGSILLYDGGVGGAAHTGTVQVSGTLAQNTTYILPDPAAGSATICLSTGNCAGSGGGVTSPGGTTGRIAKFTGSNTIADSTLNESGTTVTATGNVVIQGSNSLSLGTASSLDGSIRFYNSAGANYVAIQAPATNPSGNLAFTLPSSYGSNGDCLQSNGSGGLTFTTCTGGAGGGVTSIDGQAGVVTISNATGSGGVITLDDATTAAKGIASFSSSNFSVSSGAVSIATGGIGATELASNSVTTAKITDGNVTNAKLQNSSLTVTAGTNLNGGGTVSLGGTVTLNVANSPSFSGALSVTGTSSLNGGATIRGLTVNNGTATEDQIFIEIAATGSNRFNGTITNADLTATRTYTLPDASGTFCLSTGNCAGAGSGVTATTPGSANRLAIFTAGQDITSSWLVQNVSTLELDNTRNLSLLGGNITANGNINTSGSGTITSASTVQGTQLISTVATGTSPLQVASTTLVSNFNADLLDGQTGAFYQNASNINAGTLAVSNGGTGLTTYTIGDLLYASGAATLSKLAAVASGSCLISQGVGTAPAWGSCGLSAEADTLATVTARGATTSTNTTFNGTLSVNSDATFTFSGTENLVVNSDLDAGVNLIQVTGTPSATAGTTRGLFVQQQDSANTNGLDTGIYVNNADTDLAITNAIHINNTGGGGYTNLINAPSFVVNGSGVITQGTWNGTALTDAFVSDTLTASILIGSGSTTNAVDLGTAEVAGTLGVANGGTGATTFNDLIALGTHTTGNYVANNTAGTGIAVTGSAGEGWSPTISLDYSATLAGNPALTASQSSFASTGLIFEGSSADSNELLLVAANPGADVTLTLPNVTGTIIGTGNISDITGLVDSQISDTLTASILIGSGSTTNAVDLSTAEVAGTLGAANGGTGITSYTVGDLLYASGATTLSKLAAVASGSCLISQGVGTAPAWGSCSGSSGITGSGTNGEVTYFNGTGTVTSSSNLLFNGTTLTSNALTVTNGATFNGTLNANANVNFTFNGTERFAITSDLDGSLNALQVVGTPSATAGTTRGILVQQADSANTNGIDSGVLVNNADTDLAIGAAIQIANSGGGGYTNYISAPSFTLNGSGTITAGTWNGTALTDAFVSDTLTASILIGSGSTTNAVDLGTAEVAGTLGVANGGTGIASYTVGDLLFASGATTLSRLAAVASGSCLISQGVGTAPAWGSCSTGGGVTGSGTSGQVTYFNGTGTVTSSSNLLFNGTTLTANALTVTNASTFNGTITANADVDFTFNGTENLAITSDLDGTTNPIDLRVTPSNTAGTNRGLFIQQNDGGAATNGLNAGIYINNAEADLAVTNAIQIANTGGGGYTNLINTPTFTVSGAGAVTGATGITSSGTIRFSALTTNGFLKTTSGNGTLAVSSSVALGSSDVSGTLAVGNGGTGATTLTSNGVLYGNGTGAIQATTAGTGGQILMANASGVPTFTTISGDVTLSNTGGATIAADAVALGTDTTGNYVSGNTAGTGIAVTGSAGEGWSPTISLDYSATLAGNPALTSNQSSFASTGLIFEGATANTIETLLTVADPAGSDVTLTLPNVTGTIIGTGNISDITGLIDSQISDTLTASILIGSGSTTNAVDLGTAEVGGTLGVANGGTGIASYTVGDLLYASGATTLSRLAAVASGSCLVSQGVGTAPAWGSCGLSAEADTLATVTARGATTSTNTTFNGILTANSDVNFTFAGTENLAVASDLDGSVNVVQIVGTPSATAGTTRGLLVQQADSANTNGLDSGILINNADTDLAMGNAIQIANTGGGGYTNLINATSFIVNGSGTITAGTWNGTALTDAFVSDTLTASVLIGSGSATNAVDLSTAEVAGTLDVANGGTGLASYTIGDLLYASGATTFSKLAAVASGSCLISQGVGTAPAWGSCSTGGGITGSGTNGQVTYFNGSGTVTSSANLLFNGTTLTANALTVSNATTLNGTVTANADVTFSFSGTENSVINSDLGGSVNMLQLTGTPSATAGTTRGILVQQADSTNTNGLDQAIRINNADTDLAIAAAIQIGDTGGGGYTNLLDTPNIDISGAGVISGATGITSSGTISLGGTAASSLTTSAGALTLTSAAAATWSTTAGNLTLQAAATLNLGTATTTGVSISRTGVATTINGSLTVTEAATFNGGLSVAAAANFSTLKSTSDIALGTTVTTNNYALPSGVVFHVTDTDGTAKTITGFTGGSNGRMITLINKTGSTLSLSSDNVGSTAANRIYTGTGGTGTDIRSNGSIQLIYDSTDSRWRVIADSADVSCTSCANRDLGNLQTTSINQNLLSNSNGTKDIGSSSNRWNWIYGNRLDIRDSASSNPIATFTNTYNAVGGNPDILWLDYSALNCNDNTSPYLSNVNDFVALHENGGTYIGGISAVQSSSNCAAGTHVAYKTNGADYAEYFLSDANNKPEPHELVSFKSNSQDKVTERATDPNLPIIGAVSITAGFVGNGPVCTKGTENTGCIENYDTTNSLVSLVGQVKVKVNNSKGAIQVGDPIGLSTTPGIGSKLTGSGYIVGYAMEALNGTSGEVMVLIRPSFYTSPMGETLQGNSLTVDGDTTIGGSLSVGANLNVSGATTLNSLTVTGNATVQGSLVVVGNIETRNITVNGHIITAGNIPQVTVGAAAGVSAPAVVVDGNDSAGTVSITTGTQNTAHGVLAHITFAEAFSGKYKVVLSASNDKAGLLRVHTVKTATGFDIVANDPVSTLTQYDFDYIVLGTLAP